MNKRSILCVFVTTALFAQQPQLDFLNHNRPVLDAHNCYPYKGKFADRIDRALSTGFPVAIEQDIAWAVNPATHQGRPVVSHTPKTTGSEPTLRDYFFERVRPIIEKALAENDHARWPLIILHFDFKSVEPKLLRAVWDELGEYQEWITTAPQTADSHELAPLDAKPLLVLTEDADEQEQVFFRDIPASARLRVFGSAHTAPIASRSEQQLIHLAATLPPEQLLVERPTNYRRWWNNSWYEVEEGGQNRAGDWTPVDAQRLRALVDHAHSLGFWIRFYTLDGFAVAENRGWDHGYNFGSREAAATRWKAALESGVNLIATDQYEELGAFIEMKGRCQARLTSKRAIQTLKESPLMKKTIALLCAQLLAIQNLGAWGFRGHTLANLAAVERIPQDGPVFLKEQKAYIGHLGIIPDTWRGISEPFLAISEDANHSWYTEGFDFIPDPPRSRYEFILRVHDEYLRVSKSDPDRAKPLNIRYTGLEAYSIMEGYERMKVGMRLYRNLTEPDQHHLWDIAKLYAGVSPIFQDAGRLKQMLLTDIAFYMGWTGHYAADTAMPLHDSIHHDAWVGDNPKGYTRDPQIHERFESEYVDLIATSEANVLQYVPKEARYLDDPWPAVLQYSLDSRNFVEDVYRVDLRGGFKNKEDQEARELVYKRIAAGAAFLRDLAYTAWIDSAKSVPTVKPIDEPENPENPRYNPAAGSAPAPEHSR